MDNFKMTVQDFFIETLSFLPPEIMVMVISAMPVIEVKGGLPIGSFLGLSFNSSLFYSVTGNLLPILPILLLFKPISHWMMRINIYQYFYNWLFKRTEEKGDKIRKYGTLGLVLFTAVPLPTTGAYSACLISLVFAVPTRRAFVSISLGVIIASIMIGLVSYPLF
ncbi:small multi-drug export protein [Domibacillus sp. 8LH]|uniref:COG2426 family protein n=1 Tax=Domibacillus sp. 8LH TaxID=3073900 RepID=UPI00317DE692